MGNSPKPFHARDLLATDALDVLGSEIEEARPAIGRSLKHLLSTMDAEQRSHFYRLKTMLKRHYRAQGGLQALERYREQLCDQAAAGAWQASAVVKPSGEDELVPNSPAAVRDFAPTVLEFIQRYGKVTKEEVREAFPHMLACLPDIYKHLRLTYPDVLYVGRINLEWRGEQK